MNGPDKHHMEALELDDGGHVMCYGCKATGAGLKYRPPGECPTPWLDRQQLLEALVTMTQYRDNAIKKIEWLRGELTAAEQRNTVIADTLRKFLGFVEAAPVGSGVCCCGDAMSKDHHGDHSPVDQWDHSVSLWGKEITEVLGQ